MRHSIGTLLPCAALILFACDKPRQLTLQEQQTVKALTSNLVPRCVGRYLIDMPADARMSGMVSMQGAKVETSAMPLENFQKEIAERETELNVTKSPDAYPFLYANAPAWEAHTRYFMHRGAPDNAPNRRVVEGYRWENGYRVRVEVAGWDYTDPDRTSDPLVKRMTSVTNVGEITYQVFDLLRRFRGRADDEIPTEPGLCIPGGFLLGKAKEGERIRGNFRLQAQPDVYFSLEMDSGLRTTESLLQRHRQIDAVVSQAEGGRTIRKGVVTLPGWQAEEWLMGGLMAVTEVQGHMFTLEGNAMTSNPQAPFVALRMTNGAPLPTDERLQRASLTEAEALALWDTVSRSLRPRPNGF